jgi:CheY-like chemotaxis protein
MCIIWQIYYSQISMDNQNMKRILVVEDEDDARLLYKDILAMNGFDVYEAVDGLDAVEKSANTKFDLILMDIITPRKDGIEALADIKSNPAKFGYPKVVMLSNVSGELAIEKAMELGADGYMLKTDVEPSDIIAIVSKYFE